MSFRERLSEPATLRRAWESVAVKGGVAGIDRVTIDDFRARADVELERLREEVRSGRYRPLPVLRLRPPFLAPSDRALVIPTVRDRTLQRAIADLLSPSIDPTLSPACRAFRKGQSAVGAAEEVSRWLAAERWVLRADVKSFFDSIDPERLRQKLAPFVDPEGLRFLDRVLRCRIFDHHQISDMVQGIPQGSPLSPLLANLYLSEMDARLLADYPHYLRYCDDLIVLAEGETEVRAALEAMVQELGELDLKLNEEKTLVCPAEDGFVFLGYHFGVAGRGPAVKAVEALHARLEELSHSEDLDPEEVDALYRGWTAYFGQHAECWLTSPVGLLALLRSAGALTEEGALERFVVARWRLPERPAPHLALALARAWVAARREEQAWRELASACHGSRAGQVAVSGWVEVLELPADELETLAAGLSGPLAERLASLSEALAGRGRFEVASRLAEAVTLAGGEKEQEVPETDAEVDVDLLLELFQGRERVHAVEAVHRGQRSFVPVQRPVTAEDWQAHLRGEKTLALALVRAGNTASLGVLDIDVERRALDGWSGKPEELLRRALGTTFRLRAELERRGCSSLFELSGRRGYHLWIRLDHPAACFDLRRWLLDVVRSIGPLPPAIRVEELPNRDRIRRQAIGPLIKLPLGVHSKTGRRCSLLDERGEPLADPIAAIRALARLPAAVVQETPRSGKAGGSKPDEAGIKGEIGPRARQMLDGCYVLSYLARRAKETFYLNHRERLSLLCTLGHLGEEGAAALHAIISQTYNYRPEVTARHIGRLPSHPISCPKLRELHPEAAALGVCGCERTTHKGGYPTPVLLALRQHEIPAFRSKRRRATGKERVAGAEASTEAPAVGPQAGAAELERQAEAKLAKLTELRRHYRGVEASMDRLRTELAQLFDAAATDTLELSQGRLRRVRREDGEGWDFRLEL